MLTQAQEQYIAKMPHNQTVSIRAHNSSVQDIAEDIIAKVKQIAPELEVRFMGSSALGISGMGDLDIYILCPLDKQKQYLSLLVDLFGPITDNVPVKHWHSEIDQYRIEIYFTDHQNSFVVQQTNFFQMLKNSEDLRKEYEALKKSSHSLLLREYTRKKFEFFNRVLGGIG